MTSGAQSLDCSSEQGNHRAFEGNEIVSGFKFVSEINFNGYRSPSSVVLDFEFLVVIQPESLNIHKLCKIRHLRHFVRPGQRAEVWTAQWAPLNRRHYGVCLSISNSEKNGLVRYQLAAGSDCSGQIEFVNDLVQQAIVWAIRYGAVEFARTASANRPCVLINAH